MANETRMTEPGRLAEAYAIQAAIRAAHVGAVVDVQTMDGATKADDRYRVRCIIQDRATGTKALALYTEMPVDIAASASRLRADLQAQVKNARLAARSWANVNRS